MQCCSAGTSAAKRSVETRKERMTSAGKAAMSGR